MLLLSNKTPYSVIFYKPVDYSLLRVFLCLAYASTINVSRSKFDHREKPYVFMGYPVRIKGYKLYDIIKHQFFTSQDVMFF